MRFHRFNSEEESSVARRVSLVSELTDNIVEPALPVLSNFNDYPRRLMMPLDSRLLSSAFLIPLNHCYFQTFYTKTFFQNSLL